tara:strand:- start:18 stop:635 length:618 start_codon:yes stop_codon:yes gene_type:complete
MSTYASLTQDIQDFAENDDTEFTTKIDTFIANSESRLFRDAPFLPAFRASNTGSLSSGTATLTMPAGVRTIRSVSITVSSSDVFLQQRLDSYLRDMYPASATTGQPKYYAVQSDSSLLFGPTPNSTYAFEILSNKVPTGLSGGNTTTWLSNNVPDVLLYACMIESCTFLQHVESIAVWNAKYLEGLNSLQSEMMRTLGNENTVGG